MSLALLSPISYPLLYTVIGWAVVLFCGYRLMSKNNPMPYVALLFGALAVATGVYLILDLSSPYSGLFRASPAPLEQVLNYGDACIFSNCGMSPTDGPSGPGGKY